jgi:hypothetical protein
MARPASEHTVFHTWTGIVKLTAPSDSRPAKLVPATPNVEHRAKESVVAGTSQATTAESDQVFNLTGAKTGLIVA